eukprot:7225275-Ditylum_brightwellii.AAC.1
MESVVISRRYQWRVIQTDSSASIDMEVVFQTGKYMKISVEMISTSRHQMVFYIEHYNKTQLLQLQHHY